MDRFAIVKLLWMLVVSVVLVLLAMSASSKDTTIVRKYIIVKESTTTTTYLGVKCIVDGYEIHTGVAEAEKAGCK